MFYMGFLSNTNIIHFNGADNFYEAEAMGDAIAEKMNTGLFHLQVIDRYHAELVGLTGERMVVLHDYSKSNDEIDYYTSIVDNTENQIKYFRIEMSNNTVLYLEDITLDNCTEHARNYANFHNTEIRSIKEITADEMK